MNNFTKFKSHGNYREEDAKKLNEFLTRAGNIKQSSEQREICRLIAEITEFQYYNKTFFSDILTCLQKLLSECIASKCNCDSVGFTKLTQYVATEKDLLIELKLL